MNLVHGDQILCRGNVLLYNSKHDTSRNEFSSIKHAKYIKNDVIKTSIHLFVFSFFALFLKFLDLPCMVKHLVWIPLLCGLPKENLDSWLKMRIITAEV